MRPTPSPSRTRLLAALLGASLLLAGCGRDAGAGVALPDGGASVGLGAEGGEQPALLTRASGQIVVAYVGNRVGDRHVYLRTSDDGLRFSDATVVAPGDFADQAPALAEDAAGRLHLFFVSNRSGASQAVFHVVEQGGRWGDATPVAGLDGAQDLAAVWRPEGFMVAAEVMGAGLLAAESPDGTTWTEPREIAPAGAEPAAAMLPDGKTLVAYQAEGKILFRTCQPIGWSEPTEAAVAKTRLRDPALTWGPEGGRLAYAERVEGGSVLRARRFDAAFRFTTDVPVPPAGTGQQRDPALAWNRAGSLVFAWALEAADGRQAIAITTP